MARRRPTPSLLYDLSPGGLSSAGSRSLSARPKVARSISFDAVEWAALQRAAFLGQRSVSAQLRAALDGSAEPVNLQSWSALVDAAMRMVNVSSVEDPLLRRRLPRTVLVDDERWLLARRRAEEAGLSLSAYVRGCVSGRRPQRLPRQRLITD